MGLVIRRSVFTALGGFTDSIGTGASAPWQSGEVTDPLLRLIETGSADSFVWLPPNIAIGGISDPHGLSNGERRPLELKEFVGQTNSSPMSSPP